MPGIYRLHGVVKYYDWGGTDFIPGLTGISNPDRRPFAEYWMGIHPLGTATVDTGGSTATSLADLVPGLPFLLKVLDVKSMLSIQVHPTKQAAAENFARENASGIRPDSPLRNYKDDNHKPELMVALSDFWLLHGFKPSEELVYTLLNVVELRELLPVYNQTGYAGLYRHVMEMPQEEVNRVLAPLVANLSVIYKDEPADKMDEDYWVAKAAASFCRDGNIDRGIFSIYLFNLVHLRKGEGIYQDAGVPHAYLEGQNVEIMANSDNVLRGGLTNKHVDVPELLKQVRCEATSPRVLVPEAGENGEKLYDTPASDFKLSVFEMESGDTVSFTPTSAGILLLTEGNAELDDDNEDILLTKGSPAALAFPGRDLYLSASAKSLVFRATS